jgi:asparagine synthase (glutamine-hydrolysing)
MFCTTAPERYGSLAVAYRGYIANRPELLRSAAIEQASKNVSDGQIFASVYHRHGDDLQAKVAGEYALAIFDFERNSLLLTHDGLGILPVYYSISPGQITFASQLDLLVGFCAPTELDRDYLTDLLAWAEHAGDHTPFKAVCRLMPGQSLSWTPRHHHLRTTWDLASVGPIRYRQPGDYEDQFRHLLRRGVNEALRAEGVVWSELSGGLDSSSVACMAAHAGHKTVELLSMTFSRSKIGDETPWMQEVVKQTGLRWHTLDFDETPPFARLPEATYAEPHFVMPVADFFDRLGGLIRANNVQVLLTGFGGDQIFQGDEPEPVYLADLFLNGRFARMLRGLREWHLGSSSKRSMSYIFLRSVLGPSARRLRSRALFNRRRAPPPYLHDDVLRTLRARRAELQRRGAHGRSIGDQYFLERMADIGLSAANYRSRLADICEVRHPLLYRPLVEFMFAIPWEEKLDPVWDRLLQRRALQGILPEPIRRRRDKRGSEQVYFEGLRKGASWLKCLTDKPRLVSHKLVDEKRWSEAVSQARYGRTYMMSMFVTAAIVEVWLRQRELGRSPLNLTEVQRLDKDL